MYRLDIKWTNAYGDINPDTGEPEITIERVPDSPGTYVYYYSIHYATLGQKEINGTLSEHLCGINTLSFDIYYGSSCWDKFFSNRTSLQLWSEREQDYIFSGRVISVEEHMDENGSLYKTVDCESEMAYLCDSICDTHDVLERIEETGRGLNTSDVLITILELHDSHTGGFAGSISKQFYPPDTHWDEDKQEFVPNGGKKPYGTESMEFSVDGDVDTTYALIQQMFVEGLGWDIWVSHNPDAVEPGNTTNGQHGYLILNAGESGSASTEETTTIEVGKNMKSLSIEYSPTAEGRVTRIVPLGGIGADGSRLNVRSIPQYHEGWSTPDYTRDVTNEILSITYGNVDKVVVFDDLVDDGNKSSEEVDAMIQELYNRGKRLADALSDGITSISLSAADLFEIGYDIKRLRVGNSYRIVNPFFGLDNKFRLVEKITDLSEPWNPRLTFAKSSNTVSTQIVSRSTNAMNRIYNTGKTLSTRMDNSSIRITTAKEYNSMSRRNPRTVHYVDQGDGTYKAYIGNKPIVFSGGGGVMVESAALLSDNNFNSFVIAKELMLEIDGHTKLYYGQPPAFVVVNGQYCLMSADQPSHIYSEANGEYKEIFDKAFENEGLFGTSCKFVGVYNNSEQANYEFEAELNIASYDRPAYEEQDLRLIYGLTRRRKRSDEADYEYDIATSEYKGTAPKDVILVPMIQTISTNEIFGDNAAPTPYGYSLCNSVYLLAVVKGQNDTYTVLFASTIYQWRNIISGNNAILDSSCISLKSEAEKHFDLGVSKRSEYTGE